MRKLLAGVAGVVLALSLNASVWACNYSEGDYYSASTETNELVIKLGCGTEQKFTLKKETKITLNGKVASLVDLKSGDKIKVAHESATDVLSIEATRA